MSKSSIISQHSMKNGDNNNNNSPNKNVEKDGKESQTKTDSTLFTSDSEEPDNSDYPMRRSRRQKSPSLKKSKAQ